MHIEPRRWWSSTLDVEPLAWTAVCQARDAAESVARARHAPFGVRTSPALIAAAFSAIEHLRVDGRAPSAWADLSGFFPTGDGWVRLHANYPHHAQALTRALGARTRQELAQVLATRTALDVESLVTEARGIAAAVRSVPEWSSHDHSRATAGDPWAVVERLGERPALPVLAAGPLLSGVRVLDFTRVIAGPTCSQLLACLGADVLRIDPPGRPELLDQYLSNGMGKRSAVTDLAVNGDVLDGLLATADVVLLGYRPGSLARFGLDPDDLLARYPQLVVASLSAWGERGPWACRPGFDSIVQAACGIASACSDDGQPGALPVQALDHSTGYLMAGHVMSLLAEARSGIVRVSLLGAARTLLDFPPPPVDAVVELPVDRVDVDSPHGHLLATPPALTVDGATIERPVSEYGRASLAWVS